MEQRCGPAWRVPAQGPAEDQAPGAALRARQYPDGNPVPRDADFRLVHAASIDLDGTRLGDRYLGLSVGSGGMPGMGFAANLASTDTVNPFLRRTLAQKSHGSTPAASDLHLSVTGLDYFLCGTHCCELENHRAGREGSSYGVGGGAGSLRAHAIPVALVRGGLAPAIANWQN
jgi:hypothetical protein